jgi:cohesin loading factor subunit SCC2
MPDFEDDLDLKDPRDTNKMLTFGRKVRGALRDVWKDPPTDVFDVGYGNLFILTLS